MDIAGIHLGIFDLICLGILIFFFVLGLMKGFTFQVVRLVTFLVALFVGKRYAGSTEGGEEGTNLASYLISWFPNQFSDNPDIAVYVAFFLIFLAVFILGTLVAFLLRALLKRLELRSFDRLLGGLLGIVVGAVCITVVVSMIGSWLPDSDLKDHIRGSHTLNLSAKAMQYAKPFFPKELLDKIDQAQGELSLEPIGGDTTPEDKAPSEDTVPQGETGD